MAKVVWIDIDNAPHVQIFKPIWTELRNRGYHIILTAKDHAYSCEMLDMAQVSYTKVGRYYGKLKLMKIFGTLVRAVQLLFFSMNYKIDVAINHGSRSMVIACFIRRVFCISMFDYEHVEKSIFKYSTKLLVPEMIKPVLCSFGIPEDKIISYPGMKEEIYCNVHSASGNGPHVQESQSEIVVTLRAPATTAHYHSPKSEQIFTALIVWLEQQQVPLRVIISPRTPQQYQEINVQVPRNSKFTILEKPMEVLELLSISDLVIGGGGTMTREAVAMGIPSYSFFQGKTGHIDSELARQGKLVMIDSVSDLEKIKLVKRNTIDTSQSENLTTYIVDIIEKFVRNMN